MTDEELLALEAHILASALGPAEVESDAGRVKARSLDELDKFYNSRRRRTRSPWAAALSGRVVPPGSTGPGSDGLDV